ncbi:unnamed protein product [Sphenostylis stenocarpa]|uniref:PI3K/PI4K catalytic domain-containing protein n=1 Tax=Sphenostylis stenocarpa TaxID=92480 RepID=A0AA86TPN9_9FABA|nr:unnamed protein product [Sphenostylis stenocarpa]
MAGYSLVCYLLQVKDRHNGNLLMDEEGHIIHIDFGFMLSNSPGGVNFESAPFKLTRELLEVMDSDAEGIPSEFFDYFKVLCIQGFLTCRKHAERVILLVEMLQSVGCAHSRWQFSDIIAVVKFDRTLISPALKQPGCMADKAYLHLQVIGRWLVHCDTALEFSENDFSGNTYQIYIGCGHEFCVNCLIDSSKSWGCAAEHILTWYHIGYPLSWADISGQTALLSFLISADQLASVFPKLILLCLNWKIILKIL